MSVSEYDPSHEINTSPGNAAITISDIILILRRAWRLPLFGCLLGLTIGILYVLSAQNLYVSTARILVDRSVNRFLQANKILDEPVFDAAETGSQIYVLSSESIILPIVREMDLSHDREFVGNIGDRTEEGSWSIKKLKRKVKQLAGLDGELPIEKEAARERIAVDAFLKRLSVDSEGSGIINVSFASEDLKKGSPHCQYYRRFLSHQHLGREIQVYQDGEPTASGPFDGTAAGCRGSRQGFAGIQAGQ